MADQVKHTRAYEFRVGCFQHPIWFVIIRRTLRSFSFIQMKMSNVLSPLSSSSPFSQHQLNTFTILYKSKVHWNDFYNAELISNKHILLVPTRQFAGFFSMFTCKDIPVKCDCVFHRTNRKYTNKNAFTPKRCL